MISLTFDGDSFDEVRTKIGEAAAVFGLLTPTITTNVTMKAPSVEDACLEVDDLPARINTTAPPPVKKKPRKKVEAAIEAEHVKVEALPEESDPFEPEVVDASEAVESTLTFEGVCAKAKELVKLENGTKRVSAILSNLGYQRLTEVQEAHYPALMSALDAEMKPTKKAKK